MSDEKNTKEVYYLDYCRKCKYSDLSEFKDPCNACLTTPFNYDSHKPINYKEKDK